MAIYFHDAAATGAAEAAGLFIPGSDLTGITAGEFADGESTAKKTGKMLNGLARKIVDYVIDTTNLLGFTATKSAPAGAGVGLFNITYSLTSQYYVYWASKTANVLPAATSGANTDYGIIGLKSIFPNADVLASSDDIPSEGVLIPTTDLEMYGGPSSISAIETTDDNRDVVAALFRWMASNTSFLSATGNQTAVTAQNVGTAVSFTPPANLYSQDDPLSNLTTPLSKYSFFAQTNSITLQYSIDANTEVNV